MMILNFSSFRIGIGVLFANRNSAVRCSIHTHTNNLMESGISVNAQYSVWILLVCLTWWLLWRMWRQRISHQFCFIFAIENEYQSFKTVLNGDVVRARNAYYYLQFGKSTLSTTNQTKPNSELGIENLRVLSSYAPLINISVIRMEKFVKFRLTRVALLVKIILMSFAIPWQSEWMACSSWFLICCFTRLWSCK